MRKKTIRINYSGLSTRDEFDPNDNYLLNILKKHYDVEICDNPDYVLCGVLYDHGSFIWGWYEEYILSYPCVRILIEGENLVPDYNLVDYSICQYPVKYLDRNYYFPCGVEAFIHGRMYFRELQDKDRDYSEEFLKTKEYFASFIASHDSEYNIRGEFFKALNQRKRVESVGTYLNNMPDGQTVQWLGGSKFDFQRKCKFSLCFESTKHEGFITEKIVEAFYADTIPVYYGSSNIKDIFNPKAFIDVSDYSSFEDAIDKIMEIENDDELYLEMLRQPIFNNPKYPEEIYTEVEQFLCHIFDQPIEKAYRRSRYLVSEYHESFMKRATKREMEGKIWRPANEVTKDYLRHLPNHIGMKLLGKNRYASLKRKAKKSQ